MPPRKEPFEAFVLLEEELGHAFRDRSLLELAFIHRSFLNEQPELAKECNERLEFLGDSVLELIVSEYLYRRLPGTPEGELSALRSRLVSAPCCSSYMERLGLERFLLLGKGERLEGSRGRESILADLFEALVGALFLDGGLEAARRFFLARFREELERQIEAPQKNWKALLQELVQKKRRSAPEYRLLSEEGPEHEKLFEIGVYLEERELGRGRGRSKKEAQQAAAKAACEGDPLQWLS